MVTERLENLNEVIDKGISQYLHLCYIPVCLTMFSFVDLDSFSADDQSQPRSPTEVESEPSPSMTSQSVSTVFTQLSLNVSIKQVRQLAWHGAKHIS